MTELPSHYALLAAAAALMIKAALDFARERKNGHSPALMKQILTELKDNTGKLDKLITQCTLLLDRQDR